MKGAGLGSLSFALGGLYILWESIYQLLFAVKKRSN